MISRWAAMIPGQMAADEAAKNLTRADAAKTQSLPGIKTGKGGLYAIVYTCKICNHRSGKTFSKQAYHSGVVVVKCPGCSNLHLVADHLGWFANKGTDVETIMRERGQDLTRLSSDQEVMEYLGPEEEEERKD